jgi:predicted GTPase
MSCSLKHSILAAKDYKVKKLKVKEWNQEIHIRTLSIAEAIEYRAELDKIEDAKVYALVCVYAICDKEGQRLFAIEDLPELLTKRQSVLKRICDEALALDEEKEDERPKESPNPS